MFDGPPISTGYVPHQYQLDVHNSLKRFNVLVCHRRWGKTVLACNTLINAALTIDEGTFAYVAPYLKQARQVSWDIIHSHCMKIPGVHDNRSEGSFTFPNGSKIVLYGSDNDQAMRGLGFTGVVADEVADFRPETWPEVIRPALAADRRGRKGFIVFIGTPKGMNQFAELYTHAQQDDDWFAAMYRSDETDLEWLDEEELAMAKSTMSDNQYRQEFLCDFTASADNILITIDMVSEGIKRAVHEMYLIGLPKVLGVDVARFGDDRSVIMKRWGLKTMDPIVFDDVDNMHLAGVVAQQIETWEPDAVFIDGGRGEGVIDRLRQVGHPVVEVSFGGKPNNPRYSNRRAEMWDLMSTWLREGGDLPDNLDLKADLCVPTYSFDAANRMKLEAKDKIKERGQRSPDLGDALALTFAVPVAAKFNPLGHGKPKIVTDHIDYLEE